MERPLVDIVILNWNGIKDTRECLQSLRTLTYPNYRIRLVDNGSANSEADLLEKEFPEADVIKLDTNTGFCKGNNIGMQKALDEEADFVMLLNNDTLVSADLLEQLVNQFGMLKNTGALSPAILHYPEKEKVWFSIAKWETCWSKGEAQFRLSYDETYDDIKDKQPYVTEFACGCCLFTSAEVLRKAGMLDEKFFIFYDEADWCARIRHMGYLSYIIPSAYIYHKVGSGTPSLAATYLSVRNRLLFMSRHLPFGKKLRSWPCILKDLAWHWCNIFGLIPRNKQFFKKQTSRAILRGWKDYYLRRFGKWNDSTAKIIFKK
jgi:hypothetical protein